MCQFGRFKNTKMQIDTEHLHYWMCAIRESPDPKRTLDAFWQGQISSKEWLIKNIIPFVTEPSSVDIYGGWVGVLASMIFQSDIPVTTIRSIDIDPVCESVAAMMNRGEAITGRFCAITGDMCTMPSNAGIVINTSCEHITQEQYDMWLSGVPHNSLIVLQSNNYNIDEHIRTSISLDEFINQSGIRIKFAESLVLPMYTRFMLIGQKC